MGKTADIPFPGFDALDTEMREKSPEVHLEIYDAAGNMVQRVMAKKCVWNSSHNLGPFYG